jgi:hypothetical protein
VLWRTARDVAPSTRPAETAAGLPAARVASKPHTFTVPEGSAAKRPMPPQDNGQRSADVAHPKVVASPQNAFSKPHREKESQFQGLGRRSDAPGRQDQCAIPVPIMIVAVLYVCFFPPCFGSDLASFWFPPAHARLRLEEAAATCQPEARENIKCPLME